MIWVRARIGQMAWKTRHLADGRAGVGIQRGPRVLASSGILSFRKPPEFLSFLWRSSGNGFVRTTMDLGSCSELVKWAWKTRRLADGRAGVGVQRGPRVLASSGILSFRKPPEFLSFLRRSSGNGFVRRTWIWVR